MIIESDFKIINDQVNDAINQAYDLIEAKNPDYIVYLADGEYKKKYVKSPLNLNPYTIDNKEDFLQDKTRMDFMIQFLNAFYRFDNPSKTIDDSEIRINMEMMIYSQIWESVAFLKKLDRLVRMINASTYAWKINVPPMGKHKFILATKEESKKGKLLLWNIINNGFHSQIRNAFAHSDYSIDATGKRIWFYNYSGAKWQLQEISFDDWSKHFSNAFLLMHRLIEIHYNRRKELPQKLKTDTFKINLPSEKSGTNITEIVFNSTHNHFSFKYS